MRAVGTLLIAAAVALGGIALLWTVFRALGAEVDYCPRNGGSCITAYWLTVPALLVAVALGWVGARLARRPSTRP